jgi:hypothetical protein
MKYVFSQAISESLFYFFKIISTDFANVYLKIWYIFRLIFAVFRLYSVGNISHLLVKPNTAKRTVQ